MSAPSLLNHVIVALGALMASAPALADLVFTSEPPTTVAVGQTYSYRMKATDVPDRRRDDDDDRPGRGPRDDGPRIRYIARALPSWLEFDGDDTIFGTPRAEDIGRHRVRLRARLRRDQVDQEFSINVEPVPGPPQAGADIAASISASPVSASVGTRLNWKVTARNLADADVGNIVLEAALSGDAAFSVDQVDDSSCSIESRGDYTAVVCRWSPLTSGASRSVEVRGSANGVGEILAVASVSITDAVPVDRNPTNDEDHVVVRVADDDQGGGSGPDAEPPVLTLNGASTITITIGEAYDDPGATALDNRDGDLTSEILIDNPVDTNVIGRYSVTYDVVDGAGNVGTATRTVEVVPREPGGGGGGGAAGIALLLLLSAASAFSTSRTSSGLERNAIRPSSCSRRDAAGSP